MTQGAVKDKVKVKTTELSRFFGASIVSLRGDVADVGHLYESAIRYRNELPRSPTFLAIYI